MSAPKAKERDVLKACLQLLAVKGIWHERRNTGAMVGTYKGKSRFTRFGKPGVADIFAFIPNDVCTPCAAHGLVPSYALWVEVKAPGGRQSEAQELFQEEVEDCGMRYLLVSDVDQLIHWLKERGL